MNKVFVGPVNSARDPLNNESKQSFEIWTFVWILLILLKTENTVTK